MNDEMTELARRAVACENWRWMEGIFYMTVFVGEEER